jgi:hypothetical protein
MILTGLGTAPLTEKIPATAATATAAMSGGFYGSSVPFVPCLAASEEEAGGCTTCVHKEASGFRPAYPPWLLKLKQRCRLKVRVRRLCEKEAPGGTRQAFALPPVAAQAKLETYSVQQILKVERYTQVELKDTLIKCIS